MAFQESNTNAGPKTASEVRVSKNQTKTKSYGLFLREITPDGFPQRGVAIWKYFAPQKADIRLRLSWACAGLVEWCARSVYRIGTGIQRFVRNDAPCRKRLEATLCFPRFERLEPIMERGGQESGATRLLVRAKAAG